MDLIFYNYYFVDFLKNLLIFVYLLILILYLNFINFDLILVLFEDYYYMFELLN